MNKSKSKILILGFGNPILSDDSVGCRVASALQQKLHRSDVDFKESSIAGLDFLDLLSGYDRAIIIDAIQTGKGKPGQIYRFGPEALTKTRHTVSLHDIHLIDVLELGKKLQMPLPQEIIIFAIEAEDVTSFGEGCTPAVAQAVPRCVAMILKELKVVS
jgi:hydrogenase maturation protease